MAREKMRLSSPQRKGSTILDRHFPRLGLLRNLGLLFYTFPDNQLQCPPPPHLLWLTVPRPWRGPGDNSRGTPRPPPDPPEPRYRPMHTGGGEDRRDTKWGGFGSVLKKREKIGRRQRGKSRNKKIRGEILFLPPGSSSQKRYPRYHQFYVGGKPSGSAVGY